MQGIIAPGQSSARKSGGFFPHPVRFAPFPGRAGHTNCYSQPWVSEAAAEIVHFWCWCCIFSFSSFLRWPLVVSGWMQRGQQWEWEPGPGRLLTSPWIQRPSDNILADTVGWGCTRLLGKGELLQFPLLPLHFQHPEPWASTQQQGITFKEAAPASGWLVLDPQTSSCPSCTLSEM